ncbi:hypothetical protein INT47_010011 [Mucor saturninus]|uniref:Uncharacterized protein n=1 Tax=Mucor saturninus TaxID=64648 RepID=A0A8H7UPL8_9FUNG|nr:hypothetical protein INT47_010011 [Mucor saturninus]
MTIKKNSTGVLVFKFKLHRKGNILDGTTYYTKTPHNRSFLNKNMTRLDRTCLVRGSKRSSYSTPHWVNFLRSTHICLWKSGRANHN